MHNVFEDIDTVNLKSPSYYQKGNLETYDIIEAVVPDFESYLAGCVIKYISRYNGKNGIEDLEKAKNYIDKIIEVKRRETEIEPF